MKKNSHFTNKRQKEFLIGHINKSSNKKRREFSCKIRLKP